MFASNEYFTNHFLKTSHPILSNVEQLWSSLSFIEDLPLPTMSVSCMITEFRAKASAY